MATITSNPIKLTEVHTNTEAAMIAAALEEQGIESRLTGEYTSEFRVEVPGHVDILVNEADLARAQEVLQEFGKGEDTDPTDEEDHSGLTFRNFCRKAVIVGLVATSLAYLIRIVIEFFRLL